MVYRATISTSTDRGKGDGWIDEWMDGWVDGWLGRGQAGRKERRRNKA